MGLGAQGEREGGGKREGEATRGRLEPKIKAPRSPSQTGARSLTVAVFVG